MDEPGRDESRPDEPVAVRAARWFQATPAELVGLAVLVVGAIAATGLLWVQATQRPAELPNDAGTIGADAGHDAEGSASDEQPVAGTSDPDDDLAHADHGHGTDPDPGVVTDDGASTPADGDRPQDPVETAVHVTGAVADPGLVLLPGGSRVADAVTAAGGLTDDAVTELVNLARLVTDGEHVHVPVEGEDPLPVAQAPPSGATTGAPEGSGGDPGAAGSHHTPGTLVDINRASVQELETLPGIGPARAQAIVSYREEHGPFAVAGDLRAVSGIGEATFQNLADLVTAE